MLQIQQVNAKHIIPSHPKILIVASRRNPTFEYDLDLWP